MSYNYEKQEWSLNYDPMRCRCEPGDYCTLKAELFLKKAGISTYDIKVSTIRKDDTFFAGEPVVDDHKGKEISARARFRSISVRKLQKETGRIFLEKNGSMAILCRRCMIQI